MKVIGIDPGYAIVGWSVINYENSRFVVVDYGAIFTKVDLDFSNRLVQIHKKLDSVLKLYQPTEMAIEKLFFNSNRRTALNVAQARGVILLTAKMNDLNYFEYTPIQVKQSVTGYGRATKKQVIEMTSKILCLKSSPKPDDVADSLAVAVAHSHAVGSKLFNFKERKI